MYFLFYFSGTRPSYRRSTHGVPCLLDCLAQTSLWTSAAARFCVRLPAASMCTHVHYPEEQPQILPMQR